MSEPLRSASPADPDAGVRAVWGLVNDRYDVAARSASLTVDDALALGRAATAGDPQVPLDSGLAHLVVPGWGHVFARFYTNAQRDSANRLNIVYDVVRPSRERLEAARFNAFDLFPPLPVSRTIDQFGVIELPASPDAPTDDVARLAALLPNVSPDIVSVITAVLAGPHTLWTPSEPGAESVEALVSMLPPALRSLLTFQTFTLRRPEFLPRLTIAEHLTGSLRDVPWSYVVPSTGDAPPQRAMDAARQLLELARSPNLRRVHHLYTQMSGVDLGADLLAEVELLVRLHRALKAFDRDDVDEALTLFGDLADPREHRYVGREMLALSAPAELAPMLSGALDQAARFTSASAFVDWLVEQTPGNDPARQTLAALAQHIADRSPAESPATAHVYTLLAAVAAEHGLSEAALRLVPMKPDVGAIRLVESRERPDEQADPRIRTLFRALAREGATKPSLSDALQFIRATHGVTDIVTERKLQMRLSAGVLSVVRDALRGAVYPRDRGALPPLAKALTEFHAASTESAGDLDSAVRRSLAARGRDTAAVSRELARLLRRADPPATVPELVGWSVLILGDARGEAAVERLRGFLDESGEDKALAAELTPLIRELLPKGADCFQPAWLSLLDFTDPQSRKTILTSALANLIRSTHADGPGALCNACFALAERRLVLDREEVGPLVAALVNARDEPDGSGSFARTRMLAAVLEQISDGNAIERLQRELWGAGATASREMVAATAWKVGAAYRLAETVRDSEYLGRLAEAMNASPEWRQPVPVGLRESLDALLRYRRSPFLSSIIGPSSASPRAARAGAREA